MSSKNDIPEIIIKEIMENPNDYAHELSVKKLVNVLKILSYCYYNTGEELVPDYVYDILYDALKARDPKNKFLMEVGAPISKEKVKLPFFMPSLDKIKSDKGKLDNWLKKYKGPYVSSDKLDGVSALIYKTEDNDKMYTRGNGQEGQDITHLIKYVVSKNVNLNEVPNHVAIRGELIISKKNFKKISNEFKNARNTVAGLVNSKHYSEKIAKLTEFVAYAVINGNYTQEEQMKNLKKWNFSTVVNKVDKKINNETLSKYLNERRKNGEYEIDGIVVVDSSKVYKYENKNPDYGFAFKAVMPDQVAEATVLDVLWDVSKHGYLKPRIKIKPISLVGVTINYATAFNAKFIKDNNLGPGSVIKLVRSGDVIPYILEVLKPSTSGKPQMPDIPYKWNDTGIDIIVKDIHGDAKDRILTKQITSFFKVMDVKYISEGIVTKLVDSGYNSVLKILKADHDDLVDIEGIGNKLVDKIYENIKNSFKTVNLYTLMAASNTLGRGLGRRKLKLITTTYPNILTTDWDKDTFIEKIVAIDGFDYKTATLFVDNFSNFKKFFKKIETVVDVKHLKKVTNVTKIVTEGEFIDMKIVFTGFRDKELEKFIEDNGGKITGTVSSNTSIVVYSDESSSKYKKAVDIGVKVMTKEQFVSKYKTTSKTVV